MQIRVEAGDMYNVLTDHGIEVTEAKAIILDLLLKAEGTTLGESIPSEEATEQRSVESDEADENLSGVESLSVENTTGKVAHGEEKTKIRRKRLNFGAFGGADSLT
jgi:hypothetical protein